MKPRRVVEASDNWHGSQRLSSIKLGTVRALNNYKQKTPEYSYGQRPRRLCYRA